ncbi:MAG: 4-methylaminobutanoate oxidase (formaldehyde-forming) [Rhodospirillaceae bacterium]|nr:MAG: 4-methylaminobutanoate oxidase (formaldehyde-forming) [Rhodospirillaceae bacterium]
MKRQTEAVIIGGGVIGCSIAYHLAKLGMTDVMLLERQELTSGSSWHAAGGVHGLHDTNNIARLQYYTMNLYRELEQETRQSVGFHQTGYLYLAQTEDRAHQLRISAAKARQFSGVEFHEISLEEAAKRHPFVNLDGIRMAVWESESGHVDVNGVTHAYAQAARNRGVSIERFCPVVETNPRPDGGWDVVTEKGTIQTRVLVNAAGLWGREVARLAGLELPLMPLEHQYFVTEEIPEVAALDFKLPAVADRDGEYYLRQEGKGFLVGAYERDGRYWSENGTPLDFGHELLNDDLDRIADNVMRACERLPVLGEAGIKRVINGPMIWSPDAAALLGPVPELSNYYTACGIIPGFSQSGGLGLTLAQWIIDGEPEYDMFPWDMARYGDWAGKAFTRARTLETYGTRFSIHFPFEEREGGRPVRKRPVYDLQKQLGAVFGLNFGWEHPLWYAPEGVVAEDSYGFERQDWWHHVGAECRALRSGVGIIDVSNFAKYEIRGAGAARWLNQVVANRVPTEVGRSCLTPLLSVRGGIAGDFTIIMLDEEHFLMIGSGMAERYHRRFFNAVPRPDSVSFQSMTSGWAGFNVAGPSARELLGRLTNDDISNEAFRFMRSRQMTVAGLAAKVLRVSFTGDLGYEIYVPETDQQALYQALLDAGQELSVRPVGSRALMSLRLEKGYGSWGREYSPEYWPQEVGLDRLIKLDKDEDFLGKQAYIELMDQPPRERLVVMRVDTPDNADPVGGEPIFSRSGDYIGRVSSGGYSYTTEQGLALGFLKPAYCEPGTAVDVSALGLPHNGTVLREAPFDPSGLRLRC